jgi:hypothetical protein
MSPAPDNTDELVAGLRQHGSQIFESYAREVKQRLSGNGKGTMAPAELRDYCSQLMSMAALAASIEPF